MISGKVEPIRRDLALHFAASLGPQARARILAEEGARILSKADAAQLAQLGIVPPKRTFVDGAESEDLARVKPEGVIVRIYDVMPLVLAWLGNELWKHSPVRSGRYQESHRLLADGTEIAQVVENFTLAAVPSGTREFLFIPTVPYARRLEPVDGRKAWSPKAPDGIYHAVATLARPKLLRLVSVSFTYRSLAGMPESKAEQRARPNSPRDFRMPALLIEAK